MELYDTHTHLNADRYDGRLDDLILEAKREGVRYMNVVGFDAETNRKAQQIANQYANLYASAGLHPTDAHTFTQQDLDQVEAYLKEAKTVAVGECGLDYYWHKDTVQVQKEIFWAQIALAKQYQKPLIIHCRDAMQDLYDLLAEASGDGKLQGVMHSYSGSAEMAKRFIELGFYISLSGPVTFKNARGPKEVAKQVPLDRLLIETDCPYLTPHPYRGKENRPALVKLVAEEIARIKGISLEEVAEQTTRNGKQLFQIGSL